MIPRVSCPERPLCSPLAIVPLMNVGSAFFARNNGLCFDTSEVESSRVMSCRVELSPIQSNPIPTNELNARPAASASAARAAAVRRLEYREIERRAPAATHAARAGGESLDRWPLDSRTPASTSDAFSDRRLVIDRRPLLTLPVAITRLASPSLRLQDDPLPSPSPSPAAYAPMWLADSHTVQFCSVQFGRNSVLARLGYRLSCSRCYRHATSLRC